MPQESVFKPLRNADFRVLWMATLASNLGGLIQAVGAGWMMATLTPSHGMVALVQSSNTLPIMAFSLLAGVLADSFNRRHVMMAAQVFMVGASAALALCGWLGLLTPWLLLIFTFLIGCGMALFNPSWQASMGDIVARDDLPAAVSLNSMGFNMMRSLGPAIGGLIVAFTSPAVAFLLNAVSYLPLIGALLRWRPVYAQVSLPREPLGAALGAGFRYVLMSPALLRVMARSAVFGAAAVSVLALLPLVARDILHGTAVTFGILLACFGLGAIGGGMLNTWMRARLRNETIVRLSFIGYAIGVAVLAFSGWMVVSCAALMLAGACWVLTLSLFNVTVQLATPRWVVGRALSFYQTSVFGGMAIGAWIWGAIADAQGVAVALYAAGGMLLIGGALGIWLRLAQFSTQDLDPIERANASHPKLDIRARSGPIVVTVDYRIDFSETERFLDLMQKRRQILLRDGARQWALLRDLETPESWTETYHLPTWIDYLRQRGRRTRSDAEIFDALRTLHLGPPETPRVRRMIERQTVPDHDDAPPLPSESMPTQ